MKLSNGTKIDGIEWAWEGHLRGGGEEVRDVLLGAVVGVAVCDMAKNPSFVQRNPVSKFEWIWFSRQIFHVSPILDYMRRIDVFFSFIGGPSRMVLVGMECMTLGRKMES
jgi:hypothetical protein